MFTSPVIAGAYMQTDIGYFLNNYTRYIHDTRLHGYFPIATPTHIESVIVDQRYARLWRDINKIKYIPHKVLVISTIIEQYLV